MPEAFKGNMFIFSNDQCNFKTKVSLIMAAGYQECNDADFLRVDPSRRLALGKYEEFTASQSMLSRFENEVPGKEKGPAALDEMLQRSIDTLLRKKGKSRLIIDLFYQAGS